MSTDRASYIQEQTEWQEMLNGAVGEAVRQWLEQNGRTHRKISLLQSHEHMGMAWAAITEYHRIRMAKLEELKARRIDYEGLRDPVDKYLGTG